MTRAKTTAASPGCTTRAGARPAAGAVLSLAAAAILLIGGCASNPPAPVVERSPRAVAAVPARPVAPRPGTYIVKPGETLFGIALDHGLDYRDLARWNGISDPNVIHAGETLRLHAPGQAAPAPPPEGVQVKPVTSAGAVVSRPLSATEEPGVTQSPAAAPPPSPDQVTIARIEPRSGEAPPAPAATPEAASSATAPPAAPGSASGPAPAAPAATPGQQPSTTAAAATPSEAVSGSALAANKVDDIEWSWPVKGKVIAKFSDPGNKGIDIAAALGDPVRASANGRVVYSGSGLRGYGKLIIIKHNATYLSAYAHNSRILVKEGQTVKRGQEIGEVGSTGANSPMLHFEIRRLGKPVDPLKFLPEPPS